MSLILYRSLLVLMTWRLLLPPGVCLCQLTLPAAALLARALGNDPPAPEPEDDDHLSGCPCSKLGPSLRAQPPELPASPAPALETIALAEPSPVASAALAFPPAHRLLYGTTPLYLTLCAFLC